MEATRLAESVQSTAATSQAADYHLSRTLASLLSYESFSAAGIKAAAYRYGYSLAKKTSPGFGPARPCGDLDEAVGTLVSLTVTLG